MPDAAISRSVRRMLVILSLLPLACCPAEIYENTAESPAVRLPLDEAPHCYGMEWWYYTGRLAAEDGRSYGIEAVVFHVGLLRYLVGRDGWTAHLALMDEAGKSFTYYQDRWLDSDAGATVTDGAVHLETPVIQAIVNNGRDHLRAAAPDGRFSLVLDLEDLRGPVPHNGGYIEYGSAGRSFYYSRPRMRAEGTLTLDDGPRRVTGQIWFDRQWGQNAVNLRTAWDWFSLRLDDGADVMLFAFRADDSPAALGTYVPPIGAPLPLGAEDFVITPVAWWTSPHTRRTYPVAWRIRIPSQGLDLSVTAVMEDQELDVRGTTFNVYWEGLCDIIGVRDGQPLTGHAYVELLNYP